MEITEEFAVCPHCGYLSSVVTTCQRCHRKLPEDVKMMDLKKIREETATAQDGNIAAEDVSVNELCWRHKKEPIIYSGEVERHVDGREMHQVHHVFAQPLTSSSIDTAKNTSPPVLVKCRNVRIGSYKVTLVKEHIVLCSSGIQLTVPAIHNSEEEVSITLDRSSMLKLLVHHGKYFPVMFVYVDVACGRQVCQQLKITQGKEPFFDPGSTNNIYKRITLFMDTLTSQAMLAIRTLFLDIFDELNQSEANEILLRSSPRVEGESRVVVTQSSTAHAEQEQVVGLAASSCISPAVPSSSPSPLTSLPSGISYVSVPQNMANIPITLLLDSHGSSATNLLQGNNEMYIVIPTMEMKDEAGEVANNMTVQEAWKMQIEQATAAVLAEVPQVEEVIGEVKSEPAEEVMEVKHDVSGDANQPLQGRS